MREVYIAAVECVDHATCRIYFKDGTFKHVTLSKANMRVLALMRTLFLEATDLTSRMSIWVGLAVLLCSCFIHHAFWIVLCMFCLWLALKLIAWLLLYHIFPYKLFSYTITALVAQENPNDTA